jgi:hypothetical protein
MDTLTKKDKEVFIALRGWESDGNRTWWKTSEGFAVAADGLSGLVYFIPPELAYAFEIGGCEVYIRHKDSPRPIHVILGIK